MLPGIFYMNDAGIGMVDTHYPENSSSSVSRHNSRSCNIICKSAGLHEMSFFVVVCAVLD